MRVLGGSLKQKINPKTVCVFATLIGTLVYYVISMGQEVPVRRWTSYTYSNGPWWQSFDDERTIYLQPQCGLGNQLVTISSALTAARRERVNLKIVFPQWDYPDQDVLWSDMFSEPQIDYHDAFPDGTYSFEDTACEVFDLGQMIKWNGMNMSWTNIKDEFIQDPTSGKLTLCTPMCLWQEGHFPSDEAWFYKSLKPTVEIERMVASFKASVNWELYQWVGVHVRRGDRIFDLSSYYTEDNNSSAAELLPLDNYVSKMKSVKSLLPSHFSPTDPQVQDFLVRFESSQLTHMNIRFFLATDDPEAAEYIMSFFDKDEVVLFDPKRCRASTIKHIQNAQHALADLFLLASSEALIGTPTSSFSLAAKLIGSGLYMEPELFA